MNSGMGYSSWHTGPASGEQVGRITDWRREGRWEMAELKDPQRWEAEGKLQLHAHLTLMAQAPIAYCIQSTLL